MPKKSWKEIFHFESEQIQDIRNIGYCYLKEGKYDTALTFFKALSILEPDTSYDLQILGAIHLQKKEYMEALSYLNKALKKNPEDIISQLNRAKTLIALGYKSQGVQQAKNILSTQKEYFAPLAEAIIESYR